jgi:sialate O-acetylesterase
MISEWRRVWSENSPTSSSFPFGFIQLATWKADYAGSDYPVIRWHQTANVGYVPNDAMPVKF